VHAGEATLICKSIRTGILLKQSMQKENIFKRSNIGIGASDVYLILKIHE